MLFTLFIGVVLIAATAIMVSFGEMLRVTLFGSKNAGPGRFEPSRDIASFAGKVVLITGAAGDLGRQTALELARWGRPSKIYIADLPRDKALVDKLLDGLATEVGQSGKARDDEATASTTFHFLPLDLTSFDSVRDCAARFAAQEQRLDLLILNAGIIRVATQTTSNGYEVHFGLNYLGHALLSKLLIPVMLRTAEMLGSSADVRVVIVSSEGYLMAPKGGIQFDKLKTECKDMSYTQRYGQSKLALIFLTRQIASRYPQLTTAAVHPGRILTGMATSLSKESLLVRLTSPIAPLVCVSVAEGVRNHLWAASSSEVVSGGYYEPVGVAGKETSIVQDDILSEKLWKWTQDELADVKPL